LNLSDPIPPRFAAAAAHARRESNGFVRDVVYFRETSSTNDIATNLATHGASDGTVVLADAQTAGRGRQGREWVSVAGAGLYVSVITAPITTSDGRPSPLITLMTGVALAAAIRACAEVPAELKWPNDLIVTSHEPGAAVRWRKLGGVLVEGAMTGGQLTRVIIGYGINIRATGVPAPLAYQATCLDAEAGRTVDRAGLLTATLIELANWSARLRAGDAAGILDAWRELAPMMSGSRVEWQERGARRWGVTQGIDNDGALLVTADDTVHRIVSGEVRWMGS